MEGLQDPIHSREINFNAVGLDYFRTMGIPVVQGRDFERRDTRDARPVAVISPEALAQGHLSGKNLSASASVSDPETHTPWATVVGVVADVRRHGLDTPSVAEGALSFTQSPVPIS